MSLLTCKNRLPYNLYCVGSRVVNETYDDETETLELLSRDETETSVPPVRDETETRRSKQRLETFGRDVQALTSH